MKRLLPRLPAPDPPAWREHVLLALTLFVLFATSLKPLANGDTFWHLALGREIWATGHLVHSETFSFTAPGVPWEDTEWLFHALSYPAWKLFGDGGLPWVVAALVTLAAALAYRSVRLLGGNAASYALWLGICAGALQTRVSFRPDVVSLIFMAVLMEGLLRWSPHGPGGSRFWVFTAGLFWLWCQLHGGWVYGYALLGSAALGHAVDARHDEKFDGATARGLLGAVLAPLAAVMVNPYGWLIPLFPLKHVLSFGDLSLPKIAEWQATPWAWSTAPFIAATLMAALLQCFLAPRRWTRIMWGIGQAALGLYWARYAGYAALTLAPFGAHQLASRLGARALTRRILWVGALTALICWALVARNPAQAERQALREFPVREVSYLESRNMSGNVLHEYPVGGFLEWVAPHRLRTFFDGRFFPFAQPMRDYRDAQLSVAASDALQEKYPLDIALYPYRSFRLRSPDAEAGAPPRGPSVRLFPAERWALVYFGGYGMVFLRRGPALEGPAGSDEYRLLRPDDLDYLTWAALGGKLDQRKLEGEIRRRLAEGDVGGSLRAALEAALGRLGGNSARQP